ncbi:unnamed protein product, partial [Didymodactylos carnosus]
LFIDDISYYRESNHWPIFTVVVSLIDIALLLFTIVINNDIVNIKENHLAGPSTLTLIRTGAKFVPCPTIDSLRYSSTICSSIPFSNGTCLYDDLLKYQCNAQALAVEQSNEVRVNGSQQKEREGQPIVMISPIVDVDTQQQQTKDAIKIPKVNKSSLIIATPRSGSGQISYFLAKKFVGYFISTFLETSVSAQTNDESRGARLDSGFEKMSSFQTPNGSGTISEQPCESMRPPGKIYSISKPGKKLNFSLLVDGSNALRSSHPMKQLKDQYNDLYVEHFQLQNKYGKLLDDYNLLRANTLLAPNVEAIEWICELCNFFVREKVTPEQSAEFEQLLGLDGDLLLHSCQKRSITSAAREIFRRTHPDKEKRKKIQPTDVSTV